MVLPAVLTGAGAATAFKTLGGSSFIFNALKTYVFGKHFRVIKYPDGELINISTRLNNVYGLRAAIAGLQPEPYPGVQFEPSDVKQICQWQSPHFTVPIVTFRDVRMTPDGSFLFWSDDDKTPIPRRGVKLDGSHISSDIEAVDSAIAFLRAQELSGREESQLGPKQVDYLIDVLIEADGKYDKALLTLVRNFRQDPAEFRRHTMRWLKRRRDDGLASLLPPS